MNVLKSMLVIILTMPVFAQSENGVSDEMLRETIQNKINLCLFYGVRDYVKADVKDGQVALSGWTTTLWAANKIAKIVKSVEGVKNVQNDIALAYGSDRIANGAIAAIYKDPMFKYRLYDAERPVHVIIQNNKLILAGTVTTEIEKERAEFLAFWNTNTVSVENALTVKE
ncbi:BON domain-containing protein [bacterium]|nr:BON domain-containing protein [bacterium]